MPEDPATAGYKKSVQKCVDKFNDDAAKTHKDAKPVLDALASGTKKNDLTKDLQKRLKDMLDEMDKHAATLDKQVTALPAIPNADPKKAKDIQKELEGIIFKGIKVNDSLIIKPSLDFDFKKMKVKSVEIQFQIHFG